MPHLMHIHFMQAMRPITVDDSIDSSVSDIVHPVTDLTSDDTTLFIPLGDRSAATALNALFLLVSETMHRSHCSFVSLLNFLSHFLPSLLSSFLMLSFLLIYLLTGLLPDLSICCIQNKPVPFPGRRSYKAIKLGFSFCVISCCSMFLYILLWMHVCFCCF